MTATIHAPELRHVSDPAPARRVITQGRDGKPIVIGGAVSRASARPYAAYGPHRKSGCVRRALAWLAVYPDRAVMAACVLGALAVAIDVAAAEPPSEAELRRTVNSVKLAPDRPELARQLATRPAERIKADGARAAAPAKKASKP